MASGLASCDAPGRPSLSTKTIKENYDACRNSLAIPGVHDVCPEEPTHENKQHPPKGMWQSDLATSGRTLPILQTLTATSPKP
eukprot:7022637-Lingulodinium_polyedra.AAC.1